ncbi:CLUMA_CG019240, isoform A [Clunio marinus]|uniref:CLUMA_CG019240, isoform A n=1 Tax=Clunio marinus TaxID=568069 RepID=A0A1J1J1M0_9DIPT|nr:CLUMA_CG019240, isoform A [Clunio marinus]
MFEESEGKYLSNSITSLYITISNKNDAIEIIKNTWNTTKPADKSSIVKTLGSSIGRLLTRDIYNVYNIIDIKDQL